MTQLSTPHRRHIKNQNGHLTYFIQRTSSRVSDSAPQHS